METVLLIVLKPTQVNWLTKKTQELIRIILTLMVMDTPMEVKLSEELIQMMKTARVQFLHLFFTLTSKMVPLIPLIRGMMGMLMATLPLMLRVLKEDQLHQLRVILMEVTSTSLALISPESFRTLRVRIATPSQHGSSQVT